jgi:hypothetical protein
LCPGQAGQDEIAWGKAWLAGETLLEIGLKRVQDSALGRDLLERVRARLADLLSGSRLSPASGPKPATCWPGWAIPARRL